MPLLLAIAPLAACRHDDGRELERVVDRAYDVYEAVANELNATADCAVGVARANAIIGERQADLLAAFALQGDLRRMEAARDVLESRQERYRALSTALDMAFARCSDEPALESVSQRLEPAPSQARP